MDTFLFHHLDKRGKNGAIRRYAKVAGLDIWTPELSDFVENSTLTGEEDIEYIFTMYAVHNGMRFNEHGEWIA